MLEGERDDDGNPANARSLIPSRHIDQTKDFPNTLDLFGPQTIINNILVYLRVYLGYLSCKVTLGALCCKAALQISVHTTQHSNTKRNESQLPEGLLLRPKLLSLLVDLTLHLQLNLAQLIIMRINPNKNNKNTPFLLLGATVLP